MAIDRKPDDAIAYSNRAQARKDKGDLAGAIADCTKAIEIKPDYAHAYLNRGIARKTEGDLDGAIADYTKAVELKPDDAVPYLDRGLARKAKGDLGGAISDYTKATQASPKYERAYYARGCLHYDSRDFTDALVDFRKAVELNPTNDYAHFRVCISRARLGEEEAATTELQAYLPGRAKGKKEDWASRIGRFLAGQLAEPEFLAAAKNGDPKKEAGETCEAYFYAGEKRLLAGDNATATDYFQRSIATDMKNYYEYASAAAELKFLEGQTK
jgi:lipoprotein NlpI